MKTLVLEVGGMTCEHCVRGVAQALRGVPGVREAHVDLTAGAASVVLDEDACSTGDLIAAVQRAGFQIGGFRAADA